MPNHTPADKPDLPALPKPSEKGWIYEAKQMKAYGRQCADEREAWARADERRKTLEFAAASIDEIDDGAAPEYRACQEHIRSKIDRKEPTK